MEQRKESKTEVVQKMWLPQVLKQMVVGCRAEDSVAEQF